MKRTTFLGAVAAAALLLPTATAMAQTVINNNVTINNGNGGENGFDNDTGQAVNWRNNPRNLEAWLYTDRTNYRPGTGVQLRLTLTNLASGSARIQLPRKGEYTISVTDVRTNRVIWSRDKSQSRSTWLELNAGGTAQWIEFWDQRDNRGNLVPMGAYRIDVRVLDLLPLSAQIFLSERGGQRPQPGNGNGGIVPPDPVTGPGSGGGWGNNGNGNGGNGNGLSSICGEISLNKTSVRSGDVVRFTYTVVNTDRRPVTLNFGSAQLFDVWATPVTRTPAVTRTPVWRLGDGVMWAQMTQQITLQPGARRQFTGTWRIGNGVASGQTLDVSASLTPAGSGGAGTVGAARTRIAVN